MSKKYISPGLESRTVEELTTQLIDVHSKLKALQKEREMMLANISHDLRAPITAIRSAVDLALSDEHLSEQDFKKTLALIDRRTATLEDLINDMYYLLLTSIILFLLVKHQIVLQDSNKEHLHLIHNLL